MVAHPNAYCCEAVLEGMVIRCENEKRALRVVVINWMMMLHSPASRSGPPPVTGYPGTEQQMLHQQQQKGHFGPGHVASTKWSLWGKIGIWLIRNPPKCFQGQQQ